MDRVLDRLWIGSTADDRAPLSALGFAGVLDLRDHGPEIVTDVPVHRLKNRDGDPWTHAQIVGALDFVSAFVRRGRVLVMCAAGMSRSACMVVGFMVMTGWDSASAMEQLRRVRPQVAPVPKMMEAVMAVVRP